MRPKVFLVCTGLGRINRGYESFTQECFDALKTSSDFELLLFKGGGKSAAGEIVVSNIHRQSKLAQLLAKLIKRDAYFIEQLTFCINLIPRLIWHRPALIYFSDFILGTFLWNLRKRLGFKYRLLFSNGAPNGPPFKRADHVQQLLPVYLEQAVAGGTSREVQTLLPYAIHFDKNVVLHHLKFKKENRERLNLDANKKIIISVGAINRAHKRMDYLINEFSRLDHSQYFLVILGQMDKTSDEVISAAKRSLPAGSYLIQQVSAQVVKEFLLVSDYFVLASLQEGLPRVLLEGLSMGLRPIVHDYQITREVLRDKGVFMDLTKANSLGKGILAVDHANTNKEVLIDYAYDNFSWPVLAGRYRQMIKNNLI